MMQEASTGDRVGRPADDCDIAVVGAGAAGLAAGIFAAEEARGLGVRGAPRVVLLDGARKIGAKILVSGGGRCNVTNAEVQPRDFNGNQPFIRNVLAAFNERAAAEWFGSLGIRLAAEESGKLFPEEGGAKAVLAALTGRCMDLGVTILPEHRVHEVALNGGCTLRHDGGTMRAARVILATGGRSIPRSGSDGEGWEIARRLGHSVGPSHPALVPLLLDPAMFHAGLSGLSLPVELSTYADGKRVDRRTGGLLWTHFGISGPVVLDASRHWGAANAAGNRVELRGNFLPGWDASRLDAWLIQRVESMPKRSIGRTLSDLLPERFVRVQLGARGIPAATAIGGLKRELRRRLVAVLVDFPFPVIGDRGWNFAEVTAGGIPLQEVDYRTMGSRKAAGLFLVGEMLDVDGRIGGFNFQWAWATGYLAGRAAVRSLFAPEAPSAPV
jgi:predicted Rossmann fold flavoprotein